MSAGAAQEAENQPSPAPTELTQASFTSSPPTTPLVLSWILSPSAPASLATALACCFTIIWSISLHLYINSSAFCSSGKVRGGFAEISCINMTLTVPASKLMAVTVEKAKSSWKCKMAVTQPHMLWLAGIEVGRSLI